MVKKGHTVFVYEIKGEGYFDPERNAYAHKGDEVVSSAQKGPLRFLLVSGKPIDEPVVWYGLIVMNTHEELRIAFQVHEKGTFIKHG